MSQQKPQTSLTSRYGYFWVTLALFLGSLIGHWTFGWYAFVQEQLEHGQSPEARQFLVVAMRDTLENWQSEFLQLIWQVAGLAMLFYVGSPQSKEGDDRIEHKIDLILKAVDKDGEGAIKRLDKQYQRD